MSQQIVTAALIIIGDEILSGRTQDINLNYIAKRLGEHGIRLVEVRVISDDAKVIQTTLNQLRSGVDYVFTTGGIGPTHDDITAENIAAAFGVELIMHPEAKALLQEYFDGRGIEFNEARQRMARTPAGATLVDNPVSVAPGFCIDNVYVMAGVPKIMQAMLENIVPTLRRGAIINSKTLLCNLPEGVLAAPLTRLQAEHKNVDIGCYPGKSVPITKDTAPGTVPDFRVSVVARSSDEASLQAAEQAIEAMILAEGGKRL